MSEKVSMHRMIAVLLLVLACALTACKSNPPKPAGAEASAENAGAEGSGATNPNASGSGGGDDEIAGPQAGLLAKRTVYFEFDSSEIKGDGNDIVSAHASTSSPNHPAGVPRSADRAG